MKKLLALAIGAILALAPTAHAQQIAGGNVYGTVTDESGAVLPGVNVTLTGEVGTKSTTTDPQGHFRFITVPKGDYTLALGLSGFAKLARTIRVTTGENVEFTLAMKVSSLQETVEVTGDTPLVDTKRRGTATTMTTDELQNVPSARDPWGVLRAVPGVLVDRVNVAGNENGQQAAIAGKGTTTADKVWNMDGLIITDMSATGASPTYFDFEAFNEISVVTGGSDLQVQSGGIGINLTTKRGTNKFHGGARYMLAHDDLARNNTPSELANDSRLHQGLNTGKGDHLQQLSDFGADIGGPIFKDKLWFYYSWGKQDIRNVLYIQNYDKTLLKSQNAKLTWQPSGSTTVSAFWFNGDKLKFGRTAGLPLNETDPFTFNQANAYEKDVNGPNRPPGLWKLQVDHTFSPNFFMSVNGAYYNTGFTLTPRGGDQSFTLDYNAGEAIGSNSGFTGVRPQWHSNASGSYFFGAMGGNHELKFGFGYRDYTTTSITHYGGNQLVGVINSPTDKIAWVARDGVIKYGGQYINAYVGDVFTKDRFTFNAGVRWDGQKAKNLPGAAPANASFPDVVPALSYGGGDNIIDFSDISPRLGLSYALDNSRRTVLRASYAYYAGQLAFGNVADENPSQFGYLAYGWNDLNADRFVQPNEVDFTNFQYNVNIDPANPGAVGSTVNKIDRNLKPKHDNEVVIGLDRELGANFAVGLAYTWRKATDWQYTPRLAGVCTGDPSVGSCPTMKPSDYTANAPTTANGYTAFTYSPIPALVDAGGGGRFRTDAPGYHTTFNGIELTLVKRLSNKWMGRVAASWNDWKEYWDGTPYSLGSDDGNPTPAETDPVQSGGPVAFLSGGSGKASFYTNVPWQIYANGLYQLPWGFDLSGTFFAKKGGVYPVSVRLSGGRDGTNPALATIPIDSNRYDNVWDMDLRLAKTIKFKGNAGVTLSAEWFNVLNNNFVMGRYRYANNASFINTSQGAISGAGRVEEILAPSVFRFGARLHF
jgi:Carboxypeptidase regulatory-like domain/TonB-dependent Receptor Plug Domain